MRSCGRPRPATNRRPPSSPGRLSLAVQPGAPIDPQTGEFSFTSTNPQTNPPANTTAKGTFSDATDMTLDANIAYGSCTYDVSPTAFSFSLYGASRFGGDLPPPRPPDAQGQQRDHR